MCKQSWTTLEERELGLARDSQSRASLSLLDAAHQMTRTLSDDGTGTAAVVDAKEGTASPGVKVAETWPMGGQTREHFRCMAGKEGCDG
jgi:hypothetical protein